MIPKKEQIILLLSILTLPSCMNNDIKNESENEIIINLDEVIENDQVHFSDLFSDYRFIPLEYTDESKFSAITKIKIVDGDYYILDAFHTNTLYHFSELGEYLGKIKKQGKGPGEYISIMDCDINKKNNSVFFVDMESKKVITYSLDGDYLNSFNTEYTYSSIAVKEDEILLFRRRSHDNTTLNDELLHIYNRNLKLKSKHFKYSELNQGPLAGDIMTKGGWLYNNDSGTKLMIPYNYTIYDIKEKSFEPYITIKTHEFRLTKDDLAEIKKNPRFQFTSRKLYLIKEFSENSRFAFFKIQIGNKEYEVLYDFRDKKAICTPRIIDDLTFTFTQLSLIVDNKFIGIISVQQLLIIKEKFLDSENFSDKTKVFVESLGNLDFNNPVLVEYSFKK